MSESSHGESPLVIAAKNGDVETVKQLIHVGVSIADCKEALIDVTALEITDELKEIAEMLYNERERLIEQEGITLPTPTPISNIEIESTLSNIERKMIELQKEGAKHEHGVNFEPLIFVENIMYLHLLEKYSNNCAMQSIYITESGELNFFGGENEFTERILDCIRRGSKIIVILLGLYEHANLLIVRPLLRTVERFEPNGSRGYYYKIEIQTNRIIKNLVENQLKSQIGPYKYIPPENMCYHGFQRLESSYPGFDNIEGGGFCMAWSLFLMELVLMNPEYTTKKIIEEGLKISKSDPKYLKEVIRGYVKDIEKSINNIYKYGFKFGKAEHGDASHRMNFNIDHHYYDTMNSRWLKINSRVFEAKPQPERPIYDKFNYSFNFLNAAGIALLSFLFIPKKDYCPDPDSSHYVMTPEDPCLIKYNHYMFFLQFFIFFTTFSIYLKSPGLFTAELNDIFDEDDELDGGKRMSDGKRMSGGLKDDILLENIGMIEMFVGKKISNSEKEKLKEWYELPGSKIVVYENNRKIINISSFDFIKILATKMKPFIEEMQMEQSKMQQQSKIKQPSKMEEEEEVQIEEIDGGKKKTQKKLRKKSRRKPRKKSRKHK